MDADEVRRDTIEVMTGVEGWNGGYLTDELLSDLEGAQEVPDGTVYEDEQATMYAVYYGNRPLWIRDTTRPGYVGRLLIYNGSANRPNDPCGTMYRRAIWFYHSPRGNPYRNCGPYWGYQFVNA